MKTAEISECGKYRYTLTRKTNCLMRWVHPALFIMLNPSTADESKDDPTIRRCISFAEREGCTDLTVINLFAFRSTKPYDLTKAADPIGPLNDIRIAEQIEMHRDFGIVVAAWGQHPFAKKRAEEVISKFGPFMCLGITQNGYPRHPLYLSKNTPLMKLECK